MTQSFQVLFVLKGKKIERLSKIKGKIKRPLQNAPFCPISASDSNFNPRNTQCMPVVKIFAFLELAQKFAFFKGLTDGAGYQSGRHFKRKVLAIFDE